MKKLLIILLLFLFPKVCFAALDAAILWEIRTTGQSSSASMNNGGGFTAGAAGTDYSHASLPANGAPILTLTDLACLDTATNLTSVTGGFTEAMIGNVIHIVSGTQATVGWYEITAYTNGNTVVIDRTCAVGGQNMTAATGNVGGCLALGSALDDDFFEALTAGNTVYISGGGAGNTHTIGESISNTQTGTAVAPFFVDGYDSTRGDNPTGTDRPLIEAGANLFDFYRYWIVENLRVNSTEYDGLNMGYYGYFKNCYGYNSSESAGRSGIFAYNCLIIDCEGVSTNGVALEPTGSMSVISCYAHDSTTGIGGGFATTALINNIIDTCTTGIDVIAQAGGVFVNNTIYNCTTGISGTTGEHIRVINNIIEGCTTEASWDTEQNNSYFDHNCWGGATPTRTNVTAGANKVDASATMTDPSAATPDFTLLAGSPCLDAGLQFGNVLAAGNMTGDYKINIGADQDDVTAAGAGGGAFGWFGKQ